MTLPSREHLRSIPSLTGTAPPLEDSAPPDDPLELFVRWFAQAEAAGVPEPRAMTLSTVDEDGMPDARVLVLKEVDERGLAFAGRASSSKGRQLVAAPRAALTFWWQPLVRSVRVRGQVVEASAEESLADLRARGAAAQQGVDAEDWRLWRVVPERIELWQGSEDRRHHRIIYLAGPEGWVRER